MDMYDPMIATVCHWLATVERGSQIWCIVGIKAYEAYSMDLCIQQVEKSTKNSRNWLKPRLHELKIFDVFFWLKHYRNYPNLNVKYEIRTNYLKNRSKFVVESKLNQISNLIQT